MKYLSVRQNYSKVDELCFISIPNRVSLGTTDVNWQCFLPQIFTNISKIWSKNIYF